MDLSAVYHHAFDNYCYPVTADTLEINLCTGKDVQSVYLIWGDPFSGGIMGGSGSWNGERIEIQTKKELQTHLWWTVRVKPLYKRCRYLFELHGSADKNDIVYFMEDGFYTHEQFMQGKIPLSSFIFPWMNAADICTPPEWPSHTVWYQIFPTRFCRGRNRKIPDTMQDWAGPEKTVTNQEKYGGNLQGITDRLDYLQALGITGLYLNPVNEARTEHKYDTADYYKIDPYLGTKKTMQHLVKEAHRRNIRIMVDGVFNHCGRTFFAWKDVLRYGVASRYSSWFMINDYSTIANPGTNAREGRYYAFAFNDGMPKLNTNNPEVRNYLIRVCEYWVKEYGIDALRLDVANELSHEFCRELQSRMRRLRKDFYIVGEIWHNSLPWLRGNEFDSVMNYPLRTAITSFWTTGSMPVQQLEYSISRCFTMYYSQTNSVLFNLMDSHDTIRLVTMCGSREKTYQMLLFMFAMPGSACIYYGTEVLLEGSYDPDCRRCMPWKEIQNGTYDSEIGIMKDIIRLRTEHPAMIGKDITFVHPSAQSTDTAAVPERIIHIIKKSDGGDETLHLVFNCSGSPYTLTVPAGSLLFSRGYSGTVLAGGGAAVYC